MPPVIDKDKCIKCRKCTDICPIDIFETDTDGFPVIRYPFECWHCNACAIDCEKEAITLRIPLPASLLYIDPNEIKNL